MYFFKKSLISIAVNRALFHPKAATPTNEG